ncbi:MAG: CvpA family protein [Paracoccaceae bacterium]
MAFTIVDFGVLGVALVSGLLAYSRGFTREAFALAGWVVAGAVGLYLAPFVEPLIREAPVIGDFLAGSCVLSIIAAIVVVIAFALLVLSVFTPLASNAVLDSALAPLDRALGFAFGVVRGLVLVAVAYFVYDSLKGQQEWPPVAEAASRPYLEEAITEVEIALPSDIPGWFGARIDALFAPCGAGVDEEDDAGSAARAVPLTLPG